MPKTLPPPPFASFSIWKSLLLTILASLLLIFVVSSGSVFVGGPALSIWHILLGGAIVPLHFYNRWAWQRRRKHAHWHRWIGGVMAGIYLSFLILLLSIVVYNFLLDEPWNWLVNGVLIGLYVLAWLLPAISYPLAKRLEKAQLEKMHTPPVMMLLWMLIVIASVLIGKMGRHGPNPLRTAVLAILPPLAALGIAQYAASDLWPYRPWAKEDE